MNEILPSQPINTDGWSFETLISYITVLSAEREKQYNMRWEALHQRWMAQEKALEIASVAIEKRLESVNEFRNQLKDQAATFLTRQELLNHQEANEKAVAIAANSVQVAISEQKEYIFASILSNEKASVQRYHLLETSVHALEKLLHVQMECAKEAVTKAENAAEKRFASVNEFRAQLADQAATFITRLEYDRVMGSITDKIDVINTAITDKLEVNARTINDKVDANLKLTNDKVDDLKGYRDMTIGKSSGINSGWSVMVGIIVTVSTMISTFTSLYVILKH